ncbi:murein hydrolase activator EnvC [Microbacterium sp. 18062]|uniref:murein hydrolase activator EnvC family protein n=1 Tax=Microbacterium sp. 18062 TaxID=2681410 RepID=UPI0013573600|nr:M23 family metallopeptidase [Microbacterium sp. 18062]
MIRSLSRTTSALALLVLAAAVPASAGPTSAVAVDDAVPSDPPLWAWPVAGVIAHPYEQPAHAYGPGHRGIDVRAEEHTVHAPDDGVVVFSGRVVDRPLVTIDHGDGIVSTLEPVASDLAPGTAVARGDAVGELSSGGHAEQGELHLGARVHGEYVNPLLLLGGIPRAVLLPCC